MDEVGFIPLDWAKLPERVMLEQANLAYQENNSRRTTRHFSTQSVDRKLIELAIQSGSTAPNGAHLQPWTWVAVSNAELKQRIRIAAEEEERRTYDHRMPEAWAEVLSPLGTDAVKEHLTDAPGSWFCSSRKNAFGPTVNGARHTMLPNHVVLLQVCSSTPCTAWVLSR